MSSRWSLKFTPIDILRITVGSVLTCFKKKEKEQLFERGCEKVRKELDCVSLLNRMKSLE